MNLQVNLLKKTEQRYQGMVSMKLLMTGSIALFAGILLIFLMLSAIAKASFNSNMQHARTEWARQEPVAAAVRQQSEAAERNRKTLALLDEWSGRTNAPMHRILHEVQSRVPEQVQLSRFQAGRTPDDGGGNAEHWLQINGWSVGRGGDLRALDFKNRLNDSAAVRGFCGEIRLISSQRESGETWLFALEGRMAAEDGK